MKALRVVVAEDSAVIRAGIVESLRAAIAFYGRFTLSFWWVPLAGLEPATHGLGNRCSIL